jgi:hypothetical protein
MLNILSSIINYHGWVILMSSAEINLQAQMVADSQIYLCYNQDVVHR